MISTFIMEIKFEKKFFKNIELVKKSQKIADKELCKICVTQNFGFMIPTAPCHGICRVFQCKISYRLKSLEILTPSRYVVPKGTLRLKFMQ